MMKIVNERPEMQFTCISVFLYVGSFYQDVVCDRFGYVLNQPHNPSLLFCKIDLNEDNCYYFISLHRMLYVCFTEGGTPCNGN